MKRTKILTYALSVIMILGSVNIPVYAVSTAWQNATEVTGGSITTDAITSALDENWYKFTTTVANSMCSLSISNEPTVNAYNMELRYQQTAGERPIILENTTDTTASGKSYIAATLENIGTYYVRVYSLTGEYSTTPYTLNITYDYPSCGASVTRVDCDGQNYDWAACAEMMGKWYYKKVYGVNLTTRNYKNAARFVQSSGSDDEESSATRTRNTLENTALATNYIFAGDYMASPVFKTTDSLRTMADFQKYIWKRNKQKNTMPVVVRMTDPGNASDRYARYLLVTGVNTQDNELTVIDPDISGSQYIVASSLTYDGDYYTYNNEAIICE